MMKVQNRHAANRDAGRISMRNAPISGPRILLPELMKLPQPPAFIKCSVGTKVGMAACIAGVWNVVPTRLNARAI